RNTPKRDQAEGKRSAPRTGRSSPSRSASSEREWIPPVAGSDVAGSDTENPGSKRRPPENHEDDVRPKPVRHRVHRSSTSSARLGRRFAMASVYSDRSPPYKYVP